MLANCKIHSFLSGSAYRTVEQLLVSVTFVVSERELNDRYLNKIPFLFCLAFMHGDVSFFNVQ